MRSVSRAFSASSAISPSGVSTCSQTTGWMSPGCVACPVAPSSERSSVTVLLKPTSTSQNLSSGRLGTTVAASTLPFRRGRLVPLRRNSSANALATTGAAWRAAMAMTTPRCAERGAGRRAGGPRLPYALKNGPRAR